MSSVLTVTHETLHGAINLSSQLQHLRHVRTRVAKGHSTPLGFDKVTPEGFCVVEVMMLNFYLPIQPVLDAIDTEIDKITQNLAKIGLAVLSDNQP